MKIPIAKITKDEDIYPRVQMAQKIIESYAEAIKAGAEFPPVTVQRIRTGGKEQIISLDGWHRVEAYKSYNKSDGATPVEEIEAIEWKEEILDREEHLAELLIAAYELNAKQGIHPSPSDARAQLEKLANTPDALNLVWKDIASRFQVTPQWVSECVAPILAAKRASRDAFIYKLKLLGWTQTEIGKAVGVSQQYISEVTSKLNQFKLLVKSDYYDKHKKPEEIAEYYQLDMPLLWAILLEGKEDIERFRLFGNTKYGNEQPELSDYWKFAERDPRLGTANYPGNLYGQEALNIVYRFSKQGDLVLTRWLEVALSSRDIAVGTIYVQKECLGDPPPRRLKVTIEEASGDGNGK